MRYLSLFVLSAYFVFATSYVGTVEPYKKYEYSASISGLVHFVNKKAEFSYIKRAKNIVSLDVSSERIELKYLNKIEKAKSELNRINRQNYKSKESIALLSRYEKLIEKKSYLNSGQSLLDTKQRIDALKNRISKKLFFINKLYLKNILVEKHSFVNAGTKLFTAYDVSKLKIELYVKKEDLEGIKKAKVLINGKPSKFKVSKVSNIKDDIHISAYKVELIKNSSPKSFIFGSVVTVSFVK
jgi:multidrug resistance efflux pump